VSECANPETRRREAQETEAQPFSFALRRLVTRSLRARVLLLALLLPALCLAAPVAAQGTEADATTYATLAREALAAAQRRDRIGLQDAGARLAAVATVRLGDGTRVAVDNRWLAEATRSNDPNYPLIAARLGALVDALAAPSAPPPPDALDRLQRLLDGPPFRDEPQDPRLAEALRERLILLLARLFGATGNALFATPLGALIAATGLLLLLAVFVYLGLGLRRAVAGEAQARDDPEAHLTAQEAYEQAGALARGGDRRTAVRYLYLAALLALDERGKLRYDRALTNREYLERAASDPALCARLAPVVETFDRVWYGHVPLDSAAFASYQAQVEALRQVSDKTTR
jgi:hypothetical protein